MKRIEDGVLEESLSGKEMTTIIEELSQIAAETIYPGIATATVTITENK